MEEDKDFLILEAYRDKDNSSKLKININAHTFMFELYRISLMLIDKIIKMSKGTKKELDATIFFETMKNDYISFYSLEDKKEEKNE
jgi:hypothetical protein